MSESLPAHDDIIFSLVRWAKQNGVRLTDDVKQMYKVVHGLDKSRQKYGVPHCPCSLPGSKTCPCETAIEDINKDGHCNCKLFVKVT